MTDKRDVSRRSVVASRLAPEAIGPYSQAIRVGNTFYCSAQIGIDPTTQRLAGGVEAQTTQVLKSVGALLSAASLDYRHVVLCRIYLTDISDYAQINEIYSSCFGDKPPCRETVQVAALPRDAAIAISCIAVR